MYSCAHIKKFFNILYKDMMNQLSFEKDFDRLSIQSILKYIEANALYALSILGHI